MLAFLAQFKSPILLLLIASAVLSGFLGEVSDAATILAIILGSTTLSYLQERQASVEVQNLLAMVETKFTAVRSGTPVELPLEQIVPGDLVILRSGSAIPGDGLVVESNALLVNESALTGESAPAEKSVGAGKQGVVRAGTHVQSGEGKMLVVLCQGDTMFGSVAASLKQVRPEPEFHRGIRRYGLLLMEFTLILTLVVFALNVALKRPVIDAFLFSLALAVGLTPQLLPAIMSVTLSRGASSLSKKKVIAKRLESIEDFGSMNVLCSDKTGTLTEGALTLTGAFDASGSKSAELLKLAQLNALGASDKNNPVDAALVQSAPAQLAHDSKIAASVPYDFIRRRQSVVVESENGLSLVTKGAVANIFEVCKIGSEPRSQAQAVFESLCNEGYRVLGVARKTVPAGTKLDASIESDMEFAGFVAFEDPLREDSPQTVAKLRELGITLKLITGDNRHTAAHIANIIGMNSDRLIVGDDLKTLSSKSLAAKVLTVDLFAEIDPVQKERIIRACRDAGFVVGYIGDGINDAPALHVSDVSISVSSAADVAKEAADFVMLERGLSVLCDAVTEGRRIFANTMKYVFINTSAMFGNVLSMAAASAFLPFLPLLPSQILLNNFLTDFPALCLAGDTVDEQTLATPRRWSVNALRTFMIVFGVHSSVFDMLTFGSLIWILRAGQSLFQTSWFIESAISELLILFVVRTRQVFFKSRPASALLLVSAACALVVAALPFMPFAPVFGMTPLSMRAAALIAAILAAYVITAELLKKLFWRKGSQEY